MWKTSRLAHVNGLRDGPSCRARRSKRLVRHQNKRSCCRRRSERDAVTGNSGREHRVTARANAPRRQTHLARRHRNDDSAGRRRVSSPVMDARPPRGASRGRRNVPRGGLRDVSGPDDAARRKRKLVSGQLSTLRPQNNASATVYGLRDAQTTLREGHAGFRGVDSEFLDTGAGFPDTPYRLLDAGSGFPRML